MRNHSLIVQIWEKNKTVQELETFIDSQTKAEKLKKKIQAMNKEENKSSAKIKTEPVAAVTRQRKFSQSKKEDKRPHKSAEDAAINTSKAIMLNAWQTAKPATNVKK